MQPVETMMAVLAWFQVKHYLADYLLQPAWILKGKGDFRSIGGHIHASAHALGSLPAYTIAGLGAGEAALLMIAEYIVHYTIDFTKAQLSLRSRNGPDTRAYWALHGGDQFFHQLTYLGLFAGILLA